MKKTLLFIALLLSFSQLASALDLTHVNGSRTTLVDLQKKNMWTLVLIWSMDCIACEAQKPMLQRFHKEHHRSNAQVLGISSDGDRYTNSIRKFLANRSSNFGNYIPKTQLFKDEFRHLTGEEFIGTPTYLLFSPEGELSGIHAGVLHRQQLEDIVGPATVLQTPSADLIR